MATTLGEVIVRFGADTAGFNAGVIGAAMRVDDFKQKIALAGLAVDAAFVVMAAASIKMAADFQQGLTRLRTGAGDTQDTMTSLGKSIQQVAMDTGVMTGPLTNAMYEILSSGQRGKQAYDTLAAAARGAQIEQANVVDVTKAVTTAMTDFSNKTINANQYMNGYIKAVSVGKVTLQDLSSALGPILPTANAVGVSFADMAAAMSVQTNAGISAARAATGLRFMLMALENPTKKANDTMASLGLSSTDVANKMKTSLPQALQMVYDAAKKAGPEGSVPFNRAIGDMVGGTRGLTAYLALTGTHMRTFTADTRLVSDAMKNGKNGVDGWALAQQNMNIQTQKLFASLQVLGQTIGSALLPVVTPMIAKTSELIQNFVKWLNVGNNMKVFLIALAVIFAVVTIATIALTVAILAASVAAIVAQAAFWPVTLVVLAIVAVIAIAIVIFLNWGRISSWVGEQFNRLGSTLHGWQTNTVAWFRNLDNAISSAMSHATGWVADRFNGMRNAIGNALSGAAGAVANGISNIWNACLRLANLEVMAFQWGANLIGGFVSGIFSKIGAVASAASQAAQAAASHLAIRSPAEKGPMSDADKWAPNLMNMMAQGIVAGTPKFQSALAKVGAGGIGTGVAIPVGAGGYGGHIVKVVIELDKREMASMLGSAMADEIRLNLGVR